MILKGVPLSISLVLAEYEELLRERYEQYVELKNRGALVKAGEVLWSAIMVLISMLSLLTRGSTVSHHKEAKLFVKKDLSELYHTIYGDDPRHLVELFSYAEKLHANFYHEFLDEEELMDCIGASERLATILKDMIHHILKIEASSHQ